MLAQTNIEKNISTELNYYEKENTVPSFRLAYTSATTLKTERRIQWTLIAFVGS